MAMYFFKMVAVRHLGFLKSRNLILTDGMQRAKMQQHAIFRQNQ